ncbi:type VII secretion protein EccE [Actinoplanes sp. RD1]|uniref:type VII secretion protein EccE n=1 Tax=Actinoplanes sp. RD1 TaxID=3064538 RepID=UPI0027428AC6|nr:type VII secretion protein EccE [Actinoplanes sp. RD1]
MVTTELTAVLLALGALGGRLTLGAAVFGAVVLLAAAWGRMRGRWAYEWVGVALRHSVRRRVAGADLGTLLEFAGRRIEATKLAGRPGALLWDSQGCAVLFDLGEAAGVLGGPGDVVPTPVALLGEKLAGQPPHRCQVLLTGVRPPGGGNLAAASYEQLTGGALLGDSRALLAVQVARPEGWTDAELRQGLERIVRALRRGAAPVRLLDAAQARVALVEAAGAAPTQARAALLEATGAALMVEETWSHLRIGDTVQATFQLGGWAGPGEFVDRLLALPARATAVALSAGPRPSPGTGTAVDLHVRLTAADTPQLEVAVEALHRMVAAHNSTETQAAGAHVALSRLDGEHGDGLIATLPLGMSPGHAITGRHSPPAASAAVLDAWNDMTVPVGSAGLMVGRNRHGEPVVARLFRSRPTRVLLIGGVREAQLVTMRALGMGARVVVRTDRPAAWEQFVHRLATGLAAPGGGISLVAVGRAVRPVAVAAPADEPTVPATVGSTGGAVGETANQQVAMASADKAAAREAGTSEAREAGTSEAGTSEAGTSEAGTSEAREAGRLVLVVVDAGPAGVAEQPVAAGQAVLMVREGYAAADDGDATAADLLIVAPLGGEEAGALGAALGLGEAAGWLARMRPGMVALINERAVRWVAVTPTAIESQLVGEVRRAAA